MYNSVSRGVLELDNSARKKMDLCYRKEQKDWFLTLYKNRKIIDRQVLTNEEALHYLFAFCYKLKNFHIKNLNDTIELLKSNSILGTFTYEGEKNLMLRFLLCLLNGAKNNTFTHILPGFCESETGIHLTFLENTIRLDNLFGRKNGLNLQEQEFFNHFFKEEQMQPIFAQAIEEQKTIRKTLNRM